MSKRLSMLEQMVEKGSTDAFHWYALAMEYSGLGRLDDALRTFTALRARDPGYVAQYLMCGTMLAKAARKPEAVEWLREGITVARGKGDSHALSELESALADVEG